MKHYQINFEYVDNMSRGEWHSQSCTLYAGSQRDAIDKAIALYGLGVDCQYHITGVIDLDAKKEENCNV